MDRRRIVPLKCAFRGKEYNVYRLPFGVKRFHYKQIRWLAKYVRIGNLILEFPDFIKPYGHRNDSHDPQKHNFWFPKQGFLRHILSKDVCFHLHQLFEMPLVRLRLKYNKLCLPKSRVFHHIVGFFLGINCGFGMKACVQYTYWMLRYDGRPIAVKSFREFLEEHEKKAKDLNSILRLNG